MINREVTEQLLRRIAENGVFAASFASISNAMEFAVAAESVLGRAVDTSDINYEPTTQGEF